MRLTKGWISIQINDYGLYVYEMMRVDIYRHGNESTCIMSNCLQSFFFDVTEGLYGVWNKILQLRFVSWDLSLVYLELSLVV